ncbi:MAG: ABC transporter permease [Flavobacteriales bacterium]|nr:ABC transporter permease [Flavobacteriales bacterium]
MLQLLDIEYNKVKKYTTFWVILIIYATLIPLIIWGISAFHFGQEGTPMYWKGSSLFKFPVVWNGVTWIASWFNLLLGILIVLIICNDFNYRTFKQNVIDGLSKQQVIASKFLFLLALAIAVNLYTFIISLLFGLAFSDGGSMFSDIYYVGIYFAQTVGYFTLAFLFSIILRKTALAIILFTLTIIINPILTGTISWAIGDNSIVQFLPINVISELTPFPLQWLTNMMSASSDPEAQKQSMEAANMVISQPIRTVVATAYIVIFVFISNLILKKRDL